MNRINKDQYFMQMCETVALRSTCLRHHVGCVIVDINSKIVSTGYNGAVRGVEHCLDKGCIRDELKIKSATRIECCEAVHAEQNALIQAGKYSENSTLFVNCIPCITCSKMIINAGIKRVVIPTDSTYSDKDGLALLKKVGVEVTRLHYVI